MSIDLSIAPQVRCGDGVVTLDFERDDYSCQFAPIEGTPQAFDDARQPLWQDADRLDVRLERGDVGRFLYACVKALFSFPSRSVRELLIQAQHLRVQPLRHPYVRTPDLAARFERMSLYLPNRLPCLFKACALLHFLACHGHRADWVIGVQLFPFRAHCWLAQGELLIGERSHLVEQYVPIHRLRLA